MLEKLKIFLRCVFLAVIVLAGVSLFFTSQKGIESNLISLLGSGSDEGLQEAFSAMSNSAKFLVKADSMQTARARLTELGVVLPNTSASQKLLTVLSPFSYGFLSPTTRCLLEKGEYGVVRDAAAARLFSPVPPVISPQKDPFLLFTDFVLSLDRPRGEWVAINVDLTPAQALSALAAVKGADDVRCAGAPFHTAIASSNSKKEINILSGISLFCVLLLGWLLVRSFRFIPILILALASSFCVSSAALFVLFEKPHAIAFVFGTTLIGMGVDYAYHVAVARSSIIKPLSASYLSTVACFLPLLFSDVEILNQMAVFTIAGLTAVFAGVLAFGRVLISNECDNVDKRIETRFAYVKWLRVVVLVFIVLANVFLCFQRDASLGKADIVRLYSPGPYLAEGERIAMEITDGTGFAISSEEQKRNFRLVEQLFKAEGKKYCEMTGLPFSVLNLPQEHHVFAPREYLETSLTRWNIEAKRLLIVAMSVIALIFVIAMRRASLDFIIPMMCTYSTVELLLCLMGEHGNFFATICFFIFMGLGFDYCVFRRHIQKIDSPVVGLRNSSRSVFYSFLTSFIGFGLLGFTDFAVTRLMGITLAVGLATSYFAAKLFCGRVASPIRSEGKREEQTTAWYEQREQCASLFWAQFMWYSYAWFGKNFQKILFTVGMPVIYVFSRQARCALKKFYRVLSEFSGTEKSATFIRLYMHILRFAWALMDKTDSCTLNKNPPKMSVRNDQGWRMFRDTVNSGKGAFLLCSHVGMISVLPSLPDALKKNGEVGLRIPKVHAFQQMGHSAVFMKVFMKHFDATRFQLHAVEDIGVETAVQMKDAMERGELVIMAGDRVSAGSRSVLQHRFLGRNCLWPKGVYRFAQIMDSPVFAVTCVSTGWNRYEVHFVALEKKESAILDGFVSFLEHETLAYPGQWYQFYDFFVGNRLARTSD